MTDPETPRPDDDTTEDETTEDDSSAFEIDLEPEEQGTAEAADEATG